MKASNRLSSSRGFTLIEIMVAATLLIVMIGASFGALIAANNSSQRIYRIAVTQEIARQGLDILAADIRSAGLGVSGGSVNIAPDLGLAAQLAVPVIYSGPDVAVNQPNQTSSIITNSIFIISAEPTTVGMPADPTATPGMQGAVISTRGSKVAVTCATTTATVGCETTSNPIYLGAAPLLLSDLRHAAVITPSSIATSTFPGPITVQLIDSLEAHMAGNPQIDPKTPYSDWGGAVLSRLRVVHWYLKQTDPNAPPRLYRSRPVMGTKGVSNATVTAYGDFLDETTVSGGVAGQEMGAGPIQSLQIRYVLDANNTNQFSQFQMVNHISPLGTADISNSTIPQAVSMLREVRVQVVSLSSQPDLATDLKQLQIGFTTPSFEGTSATAGPAAGGSGGGSSGGSGGGSGGGGGATIPTDPYPRRAFSVRVTPRALQGARL